MPKILVVDDSPLDQRVAGKILQQRPGLTAAEKATGLEVVFANNGKEALEALPRERPDLVVTDLQMPELNGLELVEAVKATYPRLPIVLMTAHGSEDIALEALRLGAASYVPKKRLAADLLETVEDLLSVLGARRQQQLLLDECWLQSESHFLLPSDLSYIPPIIALLQENLNRMKICDDNDQIRVAVALREALSNAIIHGNLEISSALRDTDEKAYYAQIGERRPQEEYRNRNVYVIAEESRTQATYIIRDDGPGFDHANLPDPTADENLERVSGRGLFLIRTFMNYVEFNDKGNQITLVKRRCHD
jgi:CheY-like chemotaxis protein/anti-sigma regulatory factor (Ser/Thr protein kinase)